MNHTPAPVATTNLMRTVGALSTTTQGFLALYTFRVWAWTLTVPLGTPARRVSQDFKRFARRLRDRYPEVHLVWTLAAHSPSCHPHVHFIINGPYSTGVISQLLRGLCFGPVKDRRALTRQEYLEGSQYDYLAFNLYQTKTTNPHGLRHLRLWGVVAGKHVKAAVRRETRSVELNGPTARLWRKYNRHLLREIEPQLVARYRDYLVRFYGLVDDREHHEAVNVHLLTRPRSYRTGRRALSFAQFRQRVLYQRFQNDLPKLEVRAYLTGFAIGFGRAAAAVVMFYAALVACFLA